MFGILLEKLGALLPKNFIIASFFPMLVFAGMNALMLYWISESFRTEVTQYRESSVGTQALVGFPVLIVVALAAYIFSTLNLLQRQALEGEYLPSGSKNRFTAGQQRRIRELEQRLLDSKRRRR